MVTISTPKGEIKLHTLPVDLLYTINHLMPFGFFTFQDKELFGLVMQCGEQELYAIKQQSADYDEQYSLALFQANDMLITYSLAGYLTHNFSGLFLPCTYQRKKINGKIEPGIAYFGYPSPEGLESQEHSDLEYLDSQFGHGYSVMMTSFVVELQQSSKKIGIPTLPVIGVDIRRRLDLGSLSFSFMVVGSKIICLKRTISEQDPTWGILTSTGITEVFCAPSVPIAITENQLNPDKKSNLRDLAERFSLEERLSKLQQLQTIGRNQVRKDKPWWKKRWW